jgi:Ribosomal L27e protein family
VVNYSHLFPTRYSVELEGLKGILSAESFKEPTQREDSKKQIKKLLEDRYTNGKNKWFFQPLRVCDHCAYHFVPTLTISAVLISPLCCFLVPRKTTCTPRMSPVIYALHPCTLRIPGLFLAITIALLVGATYCLLPICELLYIMID